MAQKYSCILHKNIWCFDTPVPAIFPHAASEHTQNSLDTPAIDE